HGVGERRPDEPRVSLRVAGRRGVAPGQHGARGLRRQGLPGRPRPPAAAGPGGSGGQPERFGLLHRHGDARAPWSGRGRPPTLHRRHGREQPLCQRLGRLDRFRHRPVREPAGPPVRPLCRAPSLRPSPARVGTARRARGGERRGARRSRDGSGSRTALGRARAARPPRERSQRARPVSRRAHAVRRLGGEQRGGRRAARCEGDARRRPHPGRVVSHRPRRVRGRAHPLCREGQRPRLGRERERVLQRARRWVLFDNFYVNGEVSADGHEWTDRGLASDYNEKTWPQIYSNRRAWDLTSGEDLANPGGAYLWDAALRHGLWVVNFGEMTESDEGDSVAARSVRTSIPGLKDITVTNYPGFVLSVADTTRARLFGDSVASWDLHGRFPLRPR